MPTSDDDLLITYEDDYVGGQVLRDKYELLRPIGAGGMGVVWIAHDRTLDVDVAVKISRRFVDDVSKLMEQRALTEARLAAQLAHPAICRVLDFGLNDNGDPFVVSELLCGEELDRVLQREGRMAPTLAVRTLLPILDGLSVAHAKGIVHRDVKPANVFLARDAEGRVQPKLLDFGVARFVNTELRITTPGMVCGTAFYMSPEQARGSAEVDARSDLWSFCASLYELVTGTPPFDGANYNAVLAAVLTSRPRRLVDLLAGDAALSAIVMRGLSRAPASRFASAHELGSELAKWLLEQGEEYDICGHSLRERLLTSRNAPQSGAAKPPSSQNYHALSTTFPVAQRRPAPFAPRALRIAVATVAAAALGAVALAFRAEPEARADGQLDAQDHVLSAGASGPASASGRVPVSVAVALPLAAPAPIVALATPSAPPRATATGAARSAAKPALSAVGVAAEREPAPREVAKSTPSSGALPRRTNALGYDFGF